MKKLILILFAVLLSGCNAEFKTQGRSEGGRYIYCATLEGTPSFLVDVEDGRTTANTGTMMINAFNFLNSEMISFPAADSLFGHKCMVFDSNKNFLRNVG